MRVYHTVPPAMLWENDIRLNVPTCTVVEQDSSSYFTGLLDARGNKLMATDIKEPIGFVVFKS